MVDIVQCYYPRRDKWETEFSLPEALGGIRACTLILPRGQAGHLSANPPSLTVNPVPKAPTTPVSDNGMPNSASVAALSHQIMELPTNQRLAISPIRSIFQKSSYSNFFFSENSNAAQLQDHGLLPNPL